MKLLTTPIVDENKYETLGLVQGVNVRSLNVLKQFMGNLKGIFGMRQTGFETVYIKGRQEAIDEMMRTAEALGADEIIGVSVQVSELSAGQDRDGYIVFIAEGTAVKHNTPMAKTKFRHSYDEQARQQIKKRESEMNQQRRATRKKSTN